MFAHDAGRGSARATARFLCPGVYGFRFLKTNKAKRTCLISLVFFGFLKPVRVCRPTNYQRLSDVSHHESVGLAGVINWPSCLACLGRGRIWKENKWILTLFVNIIACLFFFFVVNTWQLFFFSFLFSCLSHSKNSRRYSFGLWMWHPIPPAKSGTPDCSAHATACQRSVPSAKLLLK